jgi:hypothetical protein
MSQYKSTARSQQGTSKSSPYREKATQLHELFPDLPVDGRRFAVSARRVFHIFNFTELEILLTEVNGDVQLAATRVTDGSFSFHVLIAFLH